MQERYRGLRGILIGAIALTSASIGVVDFYNYESRQETHVNSLIPPISPEQLEHSRVDYNRLHRLVDLSILLENPLGNNANRQVYFVVSPELEDAVNIIYQDKTREEEKNKFDAEPVNIVRRPIDLLAFVCGVGTLLSVTKSVPPKEPKEYATSSEKTDLDGL